MARFLDKAMDYLGLSDNDSYGDYDPYEEQVSAPPQRRQPTMPFPQEPEGITNVRPLPILPADSGISSVAVQTRSSGSVRPLPPTSPSTGKVHVVRPSSFAEAQEIGERFRSSDPVIIDLTGADRDLKRRLVDFASGLTYGLNGHMEKVADSVFMLTPTNVQVSADEKRRLQERGLYTS